MAKASGATTERYARGDSQGVDQLRPRRISFVKIKADAKPLLTDANAINHNCRRLHDVRLAGDRHFKANAAHGAAGDLLSKHQVTPLADTSTVAPDCTGVPGAATCARARKGLRGIVRLVSGGSAVM